MNDKIKLDSIEDAIADFKEGKFGIRPEETLFFDDSQTNLDAASQLGFKTWLVAEGTEFMEAFGE